MSDAHDDEGPGEEEEQGEVVGWPVKGPATPQQAMVAVAFIFLLGFILGFVIARTF
jgi:hypothetical protein